VRGIGLDVYQAHWYEHLDRDAPLSIPLSRLSLDRPAWLGEFPTRPGQRSASDVCEAARAAGYTGAFAWSLLANDEQSGFVEAAPLLTAWAIGRDDVARAPTLNARAEDIPGTALRDGAPERQERYS
jgi:hypothetical protein